MKACVIFDTRYGNTEKVAKSLESGLKEAGIETVCGNAREIAIDSLRQCDLICIGAPTEQFTAYKPIKSFLQGLSKDLSGKFGFAFDTRIDSRFSGSAASYIEKRLDSLGLTIIVPRESAFVFGPRPSKLVEGEEKRFETIGKEIGIALVNRAGIPA